MTHAIMLVLALPASWRLLNEMAPLVGAIDWMTHATMLAQALLALVSI